MDKETGWHYQMMRRTWDSNEITYGIYEFYELDGKPEWSESAVILAGDSPVDVQEDVLMIINDIAKHGIRDYETGELIDAIQD